VLIELERRILERKEQFQFNQSFSSRGDEDERKKKRNRTSYCDEPREEEEGEGDEDEDEEEKAREAVEKKEGTILQVLKQCGIDPAIVRYNVEEESFY